MKQTIGLVLGNGLLPELLLQECSNSVCALLGNIPHNIKLAQHSRVFSIMHISQILQYFKKHGVEKICIAGGVTKPKIDFSLLHWKNFFLVWKIVMLPNKGDNFLLKTILSFIESKGFEVVPVTKIIPNLAIKQGNLTIHKPNLIQKNGIELGIKFLADISKYDISQACVVENNCIIALEGLEGTEKMLSRIKEIQRNDAILIKMPKTGQTLKIDMPTIGLDTVQQCIDSNIKGIVIKAEEVIVLQKEEVVRLAEENDLFILSV